MKKPKIQLQLKHAIRSYATLFSIVSSFIVLIFMIISCQMERETTETKTTNPFVSVGKLHNEGLDYVLKYIRDHKGRSTSRSGSNAIGIYTLSNAGINAYLKDIDKDLESRAGTDQKIVVSGVVTDEYGSPIICANIVEQGTTGGTVTDCDGYYRLSINRNGVLLCSFIGFQTVMYAVGVRTKVNITMTEDYDDVPEDTYVSPTAPHAWQPAENIGITTSNASIYYNRLEDIFSDATVDYAKFESRIIELDQHILSSTSITKDEKDALLNGTAMAIASVNYWMDSLDVWEAELEGYGQTVNKNSGYSTVNITGTVIADGIPLIGCNISVVGTTMGTITDMDGRYSLRVPSSASKLAFSFIGYDSKEIMIKGRYVINVDLTSPWDKTWGVILCIGGEDVKGAISGALGGLATGALSGGVGALPGAGIGALAGSIGQSSYAGLNYLF